MQFFSIGTAARLLVAVFLWLASASLAPAEDARDVATSSGLSASVTPPHSRELDAKFRQAREQLELNAFAPVVATIHEFLNLDSTSHLYVLESADNRVPASERWIGTTEAAKQLLARLPNAERQRVIERLNRQATNELIQAVASNDVPALRRVIARFPMTDASRDALRYLAARSIDVGNRVTAAASLSRLLEAVPTNERDQRRFEMLRQQLADHVVLTNHPTESVQWHSNGGISNETVAALRDSLKEQAEQSIMLAARAKPLLRDNVLVTRLLNRLIAFDATSGRELWTDSATANVLDPSAPLHGNLSLKDLVARSLGRQLQVDSVLPSLSSDDEFVASVDPVDSSTVMLPNVLNREGSARSNPLNPGDSFRSNVLRLRRLKTGDVVWTCRADDWPGQAAVTQSAVVLPELGVETSAGSRARPNVFFLGAPRFIDRSLWGVAQVGAMLVGYELSAEDGRLQWSSTIAEAPRQQAADADWKMTAARVEVFAGHVIFLTSSGLISAVDLTTREPVWGWRSQRSDSPPHWRQFGTETVGHRQWWRGWRESVGIVTEIARNGRESEVFITVGPDRSEMLAFDGSGNVVWRQPSRIGFGLCNLANGKVLLIEQHAASVLDAATGKTDWSAPIPTPTGEGFLTESFNRDSLRSASAAEPRAKSEVDSPYGSAGASPSRAIGNSKLGKRLGTYVMPSDTEFVVLHLDQRTVERIPAPSDVQLGNCIATQSGIASLSIDGLRSLPQLESLKSKSKEPSTDESDIAAKVRRLVSEAEEFARTVSGKTLAAGLHSAADVTLNTAATTTIESAASTLPLAKAKAAFELLAHNAPGLQRFDDWSSLRRVRFERLVAGYLRDLAEHDATVRDWLAEQLSAERLKAVASPDPFAVQRFAQRFAHFDAAQDSVIAPPARIGLSHMQSQLLLLSRVRASHLPLADQSLKSLADLYRARSYDDDIRATLLQAQWRASVSEHLQPSLRNRFKSDADWQALESQFGMQAKSHWSNGAPTVTEHELARNEIAFLTVPVDAPAGSLLNRLDVGFHWYSGNIVRFVGDGRSGVWTINLPTTRSNFRRMPPLVRGWGIGHLLVLRAGTELFAIAPLDESGEPKARLVWHVDTRPDAQLEGQRLRPAQLGFTDIDVQFLDAYDRPLGQVGPVRAGYLCYQSSGKLVCIDTATGQQLWERFELPPEPIVTGDEEHVFVTDEQSGNVSMLRALDGREVRHWRATSLLTRSVSEGLSSNEQPSDIQPNRSARIVHQTANWLFRESAASFEMLDLRSCKIAWARPKSDPAALPFAIDEHLLGIFEPQAAIAFDIATGRERFRIAVARPETPEVLFCASDADSYYFFVSGPRRPEAAQMLLHPRWHRNPLVSGVLIALDRHNGSERWRSSLTDTNVPLDPPKSVPFLTLTSVNWPKDAAAPATSSALSLVDKRTGQTLIRTNDPGDGMHLITPNSQQRSANVRTRTKELRLEYPVAGNAK